MIDLIIVPVFIFILLSILLYISIFDNYRYHYQWTSYDLTFSELCFIFIIPSLVALIFYRGGLEAYLNNQCNLYDIEKEYAYISERLIRTKYFHMSEEFKSKYTLEQFRKLQE